MLNSPLIAEVLFRQYYAPGNHSGKANTSTKEAWAYLHNAGLIDRSDFMASVTPKGKFFVEHLLSISFPVEVYVIPGTEISIMTQDSYADNGELSERGERIQFWVTREKAKQISEALYVVSDEDIEKLIGKP